MAYDEVQAINAVTEVLNSLVMQLVDLNTSLAELYNRLIVQGTYLQGIVDELRSLNFAMGRIEDLMTYPPE